MHGPEGADQVVGNTAACWQQQQVAQAMHLSAEPADSGLAMAGNFPVACTSAAASKQSCMFRNVCLQYGDDGKTLKAVMWGPQEKRHLAMLQQHLDQHMNGMAVSCHTAPIDSTAARPAFQSDPGILWKLFPDTQFSFGHALINEAFPIFMVLQNHLGNHIPTNVQLLISTPWHPVTQRVLQGTISRNADLLTSRLPNTTNSQGLCFRQLILGDGGYVASSRASLANSGAPHAQQYAAEPTFFSSISWWNFRRHTLRVSVKGPASCSVYVRIAACNKRSLVLCAS
jgi:hypothetical protein